MFFSLDPQRKVSFIIICALVLLSCPIPSEADKRKLTQNEAGVKRVSGKNKIDVHRLYYAYRDRVKEGGDAIKHGAGLLAENSAIAEEQDLDSPAMMKLDRFEGKASENKAKDYSKLSVNVAKYVPKAKHHNEESERVDTNVKDPVLKGMMILKMDIPPKEKVEPSKSQVEDAADRRIAELNRIYKGLVNAWQKPQVEAKKSSCPIRLNALTELLNVEEHLKQPNVLDEFVKAMNSQEEGLIPPVQRKIERATGKSKRSEVKTGGLYEQYRSKLADILKDHKTANRSLEISDVSQCHCDERKPLCLARDRERSQCHCDASRFALSGELNKLTPGVVQCHCDDPRLVEHRRGDQHTALQACVKLSKEKEAGKERVIIGGPNPYYIDNSKQRQMVWNDIPLMRTSQAGAELKSNRTLAQAKSEQSIGNTLQRNDTSTPTFRKNQKQLHHLLKVLQSKHRSSLAKRSRKRGLIGGAHQTNQPGSVSFPQVLLNQVGCGQQPGSHLMDTMAKQFSVSPMEMAQRIAAGSSGSGSGLPLPAAMPCPVIPDPPVAPVAPIAPAAYNSASQTSVNPVPRTTPDVVPMLEKILLRLQAMQDSKDGSDKLPCCFVEPADGAPCELTGAWESLLLGVRFKIVDEHRVTKEQPRPVCAQPQSQRHWRQCIKPTQQELRTRFRGGEMKVLNVSIEETVPPRAHELLDNLSDWIFESQALSTLGGPLVIFCRNLSSKLVGTFVGFCRNCGCIDAIFGSWTFCLPSRDCQDITMSIFDRRDVLRRYSLPDVRRERIKDHLYTRSKFAKLEKQQEAQSHP